MEDKKYPVVVDGKGGPGQSRRTKNSAVPYECSRGYRTYFLGLTIRPLVHPTGAELPDYERQSFEPVLKRKPAVRNLEKRRKGQEGSIRLSIIGDGVTTCHRRWSNLRLFKRISSTTTPECGSPAKPRKQRKHRAMITLLTSNFSKTAQYAVAVLGVILAWLLRELVNPILGDRVPFILFYPAVVLSAWFGGLRPGLLATALSGFFAAYVFMPPAYSFAFSDPTASAQLIIFLLASTMICFLAENLHSTKRRAQEGEKREHHQSEQFRVTLASIGDAVITTDAEGRITYVNPVAETLLGYSLAQAKSRPLGQVFNIVNEFTRRVAENPVEQVLREGQIISLANHTVLMRPNGTEVPIDDSAAPIHDDAGAIVGVVLVFRDITERRRAEKAKATLAAIVESSDDAIISKDLNGRIMTWNAGAERLFGYREQEVIGRPITLIIPHSHLNEETMILQRIRDGERIDHYETVRQGKDGSLLDISLTISPIRDGLGNIVGASKVARDITQRKLIEEALRESQERYRRQAQELEQQLIMSGRLVSLGEVTASMAHEFNNPLGIIMGFVEDMLGNTDPADPNYRALQIIDEELKRCRQIVRDLMEYARPRSTEFCPTSIVDVIDKTLQLVENRLYKQKVSVEKTLEPELPRIQADSSQLEQVLVNLYLNAIDAMPEGGKLIVESRMVQTDSTAPMVEITVADTGFGIAETDLAKIFQPFFTAKKRRGMGLGLPICQRIVKNHGGRIEVKSQLGIGTTFMIYLPVEWTPITEENF
jgi:PAS domain S-box-containing protein